MTIRKIFTPLQHEPSAAASLAAALTLAKEFSAHVDALFVRQSPAVPASGYYPVEVLYVEQHMDELAKAIDDQAMRLKAEVERAAAGAGATLIESGARPDGAAATIAWRDRKGVVPFDLAAASRVADLVCLARSSDDGAQTSLIEDLLFQSGRPLYLAPPTGRSLFPRRIVVGWNGGREGARALAAAGPFLKKAESVAVLSVGQTPAGHEGPESAAALLRLHGVGAEARRVEARDGEAAEKTFLSAVRDMGGDLIVAGAYSHSRWRELILGGFTRHLLRNADMPLLLAH